MIALMSLAAEGTPRLALELSREWIAVGVQPIIVVMQGSPNDLASDFEALGLERITLNLPERGYARYLILAFQIFRIARAHRPAALLSMSLGWHAFMAIGARLAGVDRIIAHVGNYPDASTGNAFRKFKFLVQFGRPFTDSLVCCSQYVRAGTVLHFGVKHSETAVIYNGLPTAFSRCDRKPSRRTNEAPFIIGMVARLEGHKDQPTLIRAARILKTRGRNIRVWLIGDGSRRHELELLIDAEDVADTVELLGMRKNVVDLITQMHLFAFSTTSDEGFGIALIEAMAATVPVVASDVGACREVLDNGRLGTLVAPADPAALANAIDAVLADATIADARAQLAQQKVASAFSMTDMARGYSDLLGLPMPETSPDFAA
ncbi:group 1 glycosyl transferase [Hyphomicrobium denitrificans 1NES1]|uniref:Group 1 glycosyl transferase n=1 Tax=Hyphomicrobium denitrificans 1NES1 TaxID=670307 RepID=N0B993_9HYPH|nr:group 1 glycosyl transferase [Hyphomicrobium denitrificans 1NES1]